MDAKVLDEIWANTQCPICMNHYGDKIFQCSAGHDVCASCKSSCPKCPICKSEFQGTRNFALEKICKTLLTQLKEKEPVVKEKGVEFGPKNLKRDLFSGPVQGRGQYKCCVQGCGAALPICRIINHCRSLHKSVFTEIAKDMCKDNNFHSFSIPSEEHTEIFLSPKYGLIFLRFHLAEHDETKSTLNVWAQMAVPQKFTKAVRYEINIENSSGKKFVIRDNPFTTKVSQEEIQLNGHILKASSEKGKQLSVRFRLFKNKDAKNHKKASKFGRLVPVVPTSLPQ